MWQHYAKLKRRQRSFQYVKLRPCRLTPGIPGPLAKRKPGDTDFVTLQGMGCRRLRVRAMFRSRISLQGRGECRY